MSNYDNTNRGIISKNERKQSDRHPDITGTLNVDGIEYFIDGWFRKRKDGSGSFYSLSVKRKEQQPGARRQEPAQGAPANLDDEIPF